MTSKSTTITTQPSSSSSSTSSSTSVPTRMTHRCLENLELLYIFTSHLSTSDLVNCLRISKLWHQVSSYHLWSSKPLSIPSLKSNHFLNSSIHQSSLTFPIINSLNINLSQFSTKSIFINHSNQIKFQSIFKSINSITLKNSCNLSCFLPSPSNFNSTRTSLILNHRQQIQEARQEFYKTLINQILTLEDLVDLNLINFLQSDSNSSNGRESTTNTNHPDQQPQQPQAESSSSSQSHPQKQLSHQVDINDFLIKLSNGSQTTSHQITLKSLNITTNHHLTDESLNALSRPNPLSDSFQNPHLSSYLTNLTLIDCPELTQEGFFKFLKSCENLKTLKIGKMNQLFKVDDLHHQSSKPSFESRENLNLFDCLANRWNGELSLLIIQDISVLLDTPTHFSSLKIQLETLHFDRCHITSNLIKSFPSLKHLSLYHSSIEDFTSFDYSDANWFRNPSQIKVRADGLDDSRGDRQLGMIDSKLGYMRSRQFWFFGSVEPVWIMDRELELELELDEDENDHGFGFGFGHKRLMKNEIRLLKSRCRNLMNVWV
ncbi:uncharacterized protein MELLADRAFT_105359 [Melampsora larici-populina 98AG31]|uniref:F-box domain-containing protein n=1 Tax=Melampsora larici-populina (strain 98AG31 / pathotype 3-4-7) TaxID=747676 RepID=F4RHV6_MELLP|nr:uncharacterized protein MELLADRAFT_105359 [Melampsora larici-populina 98AG31]EGG07891.1 hypothetical protein MELLADRAFT_105359 [Melampsora larici-populina 98AG31]